MFNTSDKNKKYQYPSEFGLYKCEDTNDCYSIKKKTGFDFRYLVLILTSVIVLSSVCVVLYNFISSSNTKLKARLIQNDSDITTIIPFINTTESIENQTEPQALEYRRYFPESNIPRPFLYEIRDPKPTGFQAPNSHKPQIYEDNEAAENNVKPIRTRVKNIQDIINLLTNQNEDQSMETSNKRPKFRKQKNINQSQTKRKNSHPFASDPFFPYKPQNPSDINLLSTNGLRFAPTIQLDQNPKKRHQNPEPYPNYERPIDSKDSYAEQPISVTLDLSQKRQKKRKPINYPVGFNNLYNQNHYFPGNRYQPSQQYFNKQPYYRPWNHWNLNANRQKVRNNVQTIKGQNPMIVHLNLYPKQRKSPSDEIQNSESKIHHNCSDYYDTYNYPQMKNTTEFHQFMEHMRHHEHHEHHENHENHETLEPIYNGKVTDNDKTKPNVEIQKSIGFTIVNPNFSLPHLSEEDYYSNGESESQWHPIIIADEENMSNARDDQVDETNNHYSGLEVGEVNEGSDETVTLPIPQDLFQKYFNSNNKQTNKYNEEWDPNVIRQNPNLINHRATFYDERKNHKDNV